MLFPILFCTFASKKEIMFFRCNRNNIFDDLMAYVSFVMYYLLAILVFDWLTFREIFLSFGGLFDNWLFYIGLSKTIFDISNYIKKKKFHLRASNRSLLGYSIFIFLYTLFLVLINDFLFLYIDTKDVVMTLKSLYIRTISSALIAIIYIIRNYAQVIQENAELNMELKEDLQKKSERATRAQLNMLKVRLDPHFMFNSLNALVGLIDEDPKKAEHFTLELSRIYKYIVANIDADTIELKEGMVFIENYCKLIEIRYPQQFKIRIEENITKNDEEKILPLSLQLLVENAVKHNRHSEECPLTICIKREGNYVCVTNKLNPYPENERKTHVASAGIGMKNLYDRYKLLTDRIPIVMESETEYIVKVPII